LGLVRGGGFGVGKCPIVSTLVTNTTAESRGWQHSHLTFTYNTSGHIGR